MRAKAATATLCILDRMTVAAAAAGRHSNRLSAERGVERSDCECVSCGVSSREMCSKQVSCCTRTGEWLSVWAVSMAMRSADPATHPPLRHAAKKDNAAQTDGQPARHNSVTVGALWVSRWGGRHCGGGGRGTGSTGVDGVRDWAGRRGCEGTRGRSDRRPLAVTRADRVIVLTHTSDTSLTHSHI